MAASSYNHTQSVSSPVWTISHNLNTTALVVDVFIDNLGTIEKILPLSVKHQDDNTLVVTFSSGQSGIARIAI